MLVDVSDSVHTAVSQVVWIGVEKLNIANYLSRIVMLLLPRISRLTNTDIVCLHTYMYCIYKGIGYTGIVDVGFFEYFQIEIVFKYLSYMISFILYYLYIFFMLLIYFIQISANSIHKIA